MYPLLRLTALVLVSAAVPALAADDERDCFQHIDPQLRIKGCTQMIQRDPRDATAYHNRAVAYGLLGDLDHAIADYTKTVEIRPDNASAYESRGRAYATKGDYTSAIADAQKASQLSAVKSASLTPKIPKPPVVVLKQHKPSATAKSAKASVPAPQASPAARPAPEDSWSGWAVSLRDKSVD
jgi:tetratricopeptide (TPR) repeat protein